MRLQAAIFDRDGVLTTLDEARLGRELLARAPLGREELTRRWRVWLGARVLRSADDEQEAIGHFLRGIADELGLDGARRQELVTLDYAACLRAYPEVPDALALARRSGLRIGVLTNNTAALSPSRMLAIAGLAEHVDVAVSAQSLGAAKPAPAAYIGAAALLGAPPEACLFFDNMPAWVEGARAVGMRAYFVDRAAAGHDIARGVVRDLSALQAILEEG